MQFLVQNIIAAVLCFYSTNTMAFKLTQEGFAYQGMDIPLTLLGSKQIPVCVLESVEFPDEKLLGLLANYGKLKDREVRRIHFKEEELQHLENGAGMVIFAKLHRQIPKQIVAFGIPIGFKYVGQQNTFQAKSTSSAGAQGKGGASTSSNPPSPAPVTPQATNTSKTTEPEANTSQPAESSAKPQEMDTTSLSSPDLESQPSGTTELFTQPAPPLNG